MRNLTILGGRRRRCFAIFNSPADGGQDLHLFSYPKLCPRIHRGSLSRDPEPVRSRLSILANLERSIEAQS